MLHAADPILSIDEREELELDIDELTYADRILHSVSLAFDDDDWDDGDDEW